MSARPRRGLGDPAIFVGEDRCGFAAAAAVGRPDDGNDAGVVAERGGDLHGAGRLRRRLRDLELATVALGVEAVDRQLNPAEHGLHIGALEVGGDADADGAAVVTRLSTRERDETGDENRESRGAHRTSGRANGWDCERSDVRSHDAG